MRELPTRLSVSFLYEQSVNMYRFLQLFLLPWILPVQPLPLDEFIADIIQVWQLRLPTIIVKDDIPELCMINERAHCLTNEMNVAELAEHLVEMRRKREQDAAIFVGSEGHEQLLELVIRLSPTFLTSNCPVFMPLRYSGDIKLRLDSNIIFFEEQKATVYNLFDMFAVKGGPPASIYIGNWVMPLGINFQSSKNRWERRVDLRGATFINSVIDNGYSARVIKDGAGKVVGSSGRLQDLLFLVTGRLNLTVETREIPDEPLEMLEEGSWTGEIGMLQRGEVDVASAGLGINLRRASVIEYTIPVDREANTLVASIPKGIAFNVWVYVNVFGFMQWTIFFALLIAFVIIMMAFTTLEQELPGQPIWTAALAAITTAFLFTIQLGSHVYVRSFGARLLNLTASGLTLLMFIFYTSDITAEMTSRAPTIPIRTFEDVIHQDYKVVVSSSYYKSLLATAAHGTAKHEIYRKYIEADRIRDGYLETETEIISETKTLWYTWNLLIPTSPIEKVLHDQLTALKMDDSTYVLSAFGLQKGSEFLEIFNHYILKEMEYGISKRLYRKYYSDLSAKEHFGMPEPQPLGYENVIFTFLCLGIGVAISLCVVIMEVYVAIMKYSIEKYSIE